MCTTLVMLALLFRFPLLCSFVPSESRLSYLAAVRSLDSLSLDTTANSTRIVACIIVQLLKSNRGLESVAWLDELGEERVEGEESADLVL